MLGASAFGSRVPPTSEGLLQKLSHVQGQVVLQLPGHHLHTQRQPLLTQTQRALGGRQPQDVYDTWRKDETPSYAEGDEMHVVLVFVFPSAELTCVSKVKRPEEWMVMFGSHSGVGWVQKNTVCAK